MDFEYKLLMAISIIMFVSFVYFFSDVGNSAGVIPIKALFTKLIG